jgi:hypothetical protein
MIASEKHVHSCYWAAFGLTDDPGAGEPPEPMTTLTETAVPMATKTAGPAVQGTATSVPEKSKGICPMAAMLLMGIAVAVVRRCK